MDAVKDFLLSAKIQTTGNRLIEKLKDLGVDSLEDLQDVELDDLSDTGLTIIAQRKLIRLIKEELSSLLIDDDGSKFYSANSSSLVNPSSPLVNPSSSSTSSGMSKPNQQEMYRAGPQNPQKSKIYYIFCKELFKRNTIREVITNLDMQHVPLELIIRMISERHKCSLEKYALEFYSQEGYPLCVNQYNKQFTLAQWKVENESLFYVFVRPRVQPVWCEEFSSEAVLDPKEGPHRVKIYSHLYGTFVVNVNLEGADLNTLKSKISSYTGLPAKYIHLYKNASGFGKIQALKLDINDNDCLVLRIQQLPLCTSFAKKVYIPTQIQTDRGYAKFYTILKYLISTGTVDHQKFVSAILKFSCCPPLAYAFHQLFQHKSIVCLSQIVVLFEGFFQLSESILEYFCNDVQPENCFEFCDYIFGLFMKFSEAVKDTSKVTTEKLHLQCPISNRQILRPVMVPQSDSVYECLTVEEKIRSGLGLINCTCDDLQLGDIRPALNYERFLMYKAFLDNGWSSNVDFDVWKNVPPVQKDITPVIISCTWKDLNNAIQLLKIQSPDALSSMKYCITYIEKGQFAFYTEPAKSVDQKLHVYDPIKGEERLYSKTEMTTIVNNDKKSVFHPLTDFLNPKIMKSVNLSEDTSVSAIGDKQGLTTIKNNPDEAIMVLIDCSGSMSENIFVESIASSDRYSKLTAAKELFFAFANRTDAYGFNHVIGLITFSSTVSVKVEFTQIMDHFKEVIGSITTSGQTALHNALSEATDRLIKLTKTYPKCHKRILCLTDGEDNCSKISSHEITRRLQREKIVVDTVLITANGNAQQKAITHASGGFCFMPSNLRVATRLFEMEVLLRLQDRSTPYPTRPLIKDKKDLAEFQNLITYPYDSTNPYEFKTNFASDMNQFVSSSAKKMVNLASFMGQSSGVTLSANDECVRRIVLEAKNYIRDPHTAVEIFPGKSNVLKWKILLKGPDECPYEGGIFLLLAKFPSEYPSKPPEIRFVTPIYHCNINSSGRICHPILGRNYVPSMTFRFIIDNIYGLLMAPEPLDPLDSVLASQYHDSREVYETQAAEHTEKYAKKIGWNEMKKELTEDEDLDVAEGIVCPLTNKLFVDPVSTPHGFTYERSALLDYLKNNGNRDPLAHKPVRVQDLVSQRSVKCLAEEFRKSNFYK